VSRAAPARRYPTRTCVVCRTTRQKRDLARVVRTPDGRVVLDRSGRLAGRGAYVCESDECRRIALDKGSLQRALEVPIPAELRAELVGAASTIEGGESRGEE
jgi:predicted RNA-binding protein YlxR (DUF448 family)